MTSVSEKRGQEPKLLIWLLTPFSQKERAGRGAASTAVATWEWER